MKHLVTRTLASLTLAVMGLAVAAPAQTTHNLKVNVPFEFQFGSQTFPAGQYTFTQPEQNVMVLRDARGRAVAQALTAGIESRATFNESKLKFATADGMHILSEVWDGSDTGQQLTHVKEQVVMAKRRSTDSREAAEGSQP
ncbi:MAG: hypothetical protein HY010_18350 [Acidobacteria bacterium]|nr:hypothetical protein [Acidobacteriota bacterium]